MGLTLKQRFIIDKDYQLSIIKSAIQTHYSLLVINC